MPILIISMLFFIFGFITSLNGVIIPYLRIVCDQTESQALSVVALPDAEHIAKITALEAGLILPYANMVSALLTIAVVLKLSFFPNLFSEKQG